MKIVVTAPRLPLMVRSCFIPLLALSTLASATAWAANGITLTGFGAASAAMGGVDLAVSRDTTALNTNPAGLAAELPGRGSVPGTVLHPG